MSTDVQKRIKQFETDSSSEENSPNHIHKPVKQRPSSQAFDVFESSGIVISPVSDILLLSSKIHYLGVDC